MSIINLPEMHRDARERAIRTFLWGLMIDVVTAVVLVLVPAFTSIEWSLAYWSLVGLSVARSILQAIVAYLMRMLIKPKLTQG